MKVYLDYAATTPVDPQVFNKMKPYFSDKYGNPSSLHSEGQEGKQAIEKSREQVAKVLGCKKEEIIFTSCATESNNLALKGIILAYRLKNPKLPKPHIITSAIEHHCVLHTCEYLEKFGFPVTYLPVSKEGIVNPDDVKRAIRPNTILVSIMYANNEIGTTQPIEGIGRLIEEIKDQRSKIKNSLPLFFHTDAVQAINYLDCNVNKLGVDLLSLTGHKFYAPKGVGILYVKKGTLLLPQQQGGAHESNRRAGTENVPGIVGFGEAIEKVAGIRNRESKRLTRLRNKLIDGVLEKIPDVILSGHRTKRLPNSASFCIKNAEGESMLLKLDKAGIAASSGSACTSASLEPSHVLLACGISAEIAHGSLRLSLGKYTKEKDIDYVLKVLPNIIKDLRKMSPFNR
jgi:cysteine desulfurase